MGHSRVIQRLLIANRGEIACRIARTCRRLGIVPIGVHSTADRDALHVREVDRSYLLGPPAAERSYLAIDALLSAARRAEVDAIHPGYGFLSESATFAEAVGQAGFCWVGPPPAAIRAMGDKVAARRLARAHGIATLDGYDGADEDERVLVEAAKGLGYPLMVKAAAGGGGRGMRLVRAAQDLPAAIREARGEARSAFGDDRLLLERYLERARHIEVQVIADATGSVVQLFERDCSIQRRRQKVVEEAPAPHVDPHLRARLGEAAVRVAQLVDYRGAGTVEFLLDPAGDFYFLEMNTRLQVEHPVTEAITGLDLVELQIRVAEGRELGLPSEPSEPDGHAIEARIYAEDPMQGYTPSSGEISSWDIPQLPGVRIDTGYRAGDRVGVHYDALLAKVIAHGDDRSQAAQRLKQALDRAWIAGITTNISLLRQIAADPVWQTGQIDTGFLVRRGIPVAPPIDVDAGALAGVALSWLLRDRGAVSLSQGWRSWGSAPVETRWQGPGGALRTWSEQLDSGQLSVAVEQDGEARRCYELRPSSFRDNILWLAINDELVCWRVALRRIGRVPALSPLTDDDLVYVHTGSSESMVRLEPRLERGKAVDQDGGTCVAPTPGTIVALHVAVGQRIQPGGALVTLEAMKMQQTLTAPQAGRVVQVLVEAGETIDEGTVLVTLEPLAEVGQS